MNHFRNENLKKNKVRIVKINNQYKDYNLINLKLVLKHYNEEITLTKPIIFLNISNGKPCCKLNKGKVNFQLLMKILEYKEIGISLYDIN